MKNPSDYESTSSDKIVLSLIALLFGGGAIAGLAFGVPAFLNHQQQTAQQSIKAQCFEGKISKCEEYLEEHGNLTEDGAYLRFARPGAGIPIGGSELPQGTEIINAPLWIHTYDQNLLPHANLVVHHPSKGQQDYYFRYQAGGTCNNCGIGRARFNWERVGESVIVKREDAVTLIFPVGEEVDNQISSQREKIREHEKREAEAERKRLEEQKRQEELGMKILEGLGGVIMHGIMNN